MIFFALAWRRNEIEKRRKEGALMFRESLTRKLQDLNKSGAEFPAIALQGILDKWFEE